MAVTRAEKETELNMLAGVFKGADAAILIDYRGINVPQVTELRAQLRKAKAGYKVVKNSLAKRALKGTDYEIAERALRGDDRGRLHRGRSGRARQDADDVHEERADAADQGGGGAGPVDSGRAGHRAGEHARQAGAVRQVAVRAAGADGQSRARAERRAAGSDERAGAGGKEARRRATS